VCEYFSVLCDLTFSLLKVTVNSQLCFLNSNEFLKQKFSNFFLLKVISETLRLGGIIRFVHRRARTDIYFKGGCATSFSCASSICSFLPLLMSLLQSAVVSIVVDVGDCIVTKCTLFDFRLRHSKWLESHSSACSSPP